MFHGVSGTQDYVPIFRDAGIGLVVRLNKKQCPRRSLANAASRVAPGYS